MRYLQKLKILKFFVYKFHEKLNDINTLINFKVFDIPVISH